MSALAIRAVRFSVLSLNHPPNCHRAERPENTEWGDGDQMTDVGTSKAQCKEVFAFKIFVKSSIFDEDDPEDFLWKISRKYC